MGCARGMITSDGEEEPSRDERLKGENEHNIRNKVGWYMQGEGRKEDLITGKSR